ncbi:P-loop NTPase fold protein [Streptomyces sp. ISID311]|uniref:P-loop NTPase fold protein n=1 Tax=Streptomyces sp. ISID311 TaxID=2601673 RepID=UPI00321194A3
MTLGAEWGRRFPWGCRCGGRRVFHRGPRTGAARQLAGLLVASRASTPFTLAVDAGWGMGTLMRLVDAELAQAPEVHTVWFSAWTSTATDALGPSDQQRRRGRAAGPAAVRAGSAVRLTLSPGSADPQPGPADA